MAISYSEDGLIAFIPIQGGAKGVLEIDAKDVELLNSLGVSFAFDRSKNGYVSAPASRSPNNHVSIARVLLNAKEGESVIYKDGSPTNLRRSNLILVRGGKSKHHDRSYLKGAAIN